MSWTDFHQRTIEKIAAEGGKWTDNQYSSIFNTREIRQKARLVQG